MVITSTERLVHVPAGVAVLEVAAAVPTGTTGWPKGIGDGLAHWRVLRNIHSCPSRASELVAAVQTLMIASA